MYSLRESAANDNLFKLFLLRLCLASKIYTRYRVVVFVSRHRLSIGQPILNLELLENFA